MLVTTDSGPRFFGIAFGRPVVTLFGPTDPIRQRHIATGDLSFVVARLPTMHANLSAGHHGVRSIGDQVYEVVARNWRESPCRACGRGAPRKTAHQCRQVHHRRGRVGRCADTGVPSHQRQPPLTGARLDLVPPFAAVRRYKLDAQRRPMRSLPFDRQRRRPVPG